jgi:flagellin-like hook-associated protein FlgL
MEMEGKMEVGVATHNMGLMAAASTIYDNKDMESSMAQLSSDSHTKPTTDLVTGVAFDFDLTAHIRSAKMAIRNSFEAQGLTNVVRGADEYLQEVLHRMGKVVMRSQIVSNNTGASSFVRETSDLAVTQILEHAPKAVQAQANVSKQNVLSLLQD